MKGACLERSMSNFHDNNLHYSQMQTPNPWISSEVCAALPARTAAHSTGDLMNYKTSTYVSHQRNKEAAQGPS